MNRIQQIIEGMWNKWFSKDYHIKTIAKRRKEVCDNCDYGGERTTCQLCKCVIEFKTHSLGSSCPDKQWPAIKGDVKLSEEVFFFNKFFEVKRINNMIFYEKYIGHITMKFVFHKNTGDLFFHNWGKQARPFHKWSEVKQLTKLYTGIEL